jgi:hypothetical protein
MFCNLYPDEAFVEIATVFLAWVFLGIDNALLLDFSLQLHCIDHGTGNAVRLSWLR